ncbi:MAG: endonuclease/exonuclease/phosphatase family protein, partial [Bacteroidota bacterium]|nr:endonuclease/exonuclease/phosphatase family protein [Bacteroidota bacterium]
PNKDNFFTRDQLVVSGKMLGEKIHFIVIHWPSRRGGEAKSRSKRIEAAKLSKSIIDSLTVVDPNAKVILMGDFNDDPISPSIKDFLKAKMDANNVNSGELYNTMGMHYKKGIGTLAYRDQWNLFDQFIVTSSLLDQKKNYNDLTFYRSVIFNKPFLKNKKGNFKGYPFRTYVGSTFMGGYSDHFPVYLFLVKKV